MCRHVCKQKRQAKGLQARAGKEGTTQQQGTVVGRQTVVNAR